MPADLITNDPKPHLLIRKLTAPLRSIPMGDKMSKKDKDKKDKQKAAKKAKDSKKKQDKQATRSS